MLNIFRRRHYFWSVCFWTPKGPHSVIFNTKTPFITPLGLALAARQEDISPTAAVLDVSCLGRMTLHDAETKF